VSPETTNNAQLLHELQVHQVELQLQNEELRQSQVALETTRSRYFDLYDLAPVGYLTVAANGLILEANLCAARLLGVARKNLVKKLWTRFIAKADQDRYYLCCNQLQQTGQAQDCELKVVYSEGSSLWVKLHISAVDGNTANPVLRVVLVDISERKKLDEVLQESNRNLERARMQADKANQAKSEFLSSMSHELRSPLNAILGFAQLMEAGVPPPTASQQASLEQILKGGWYLLALVNDILDLAQVESGHTALIMEPVPLAPLLSDCQSLIAPLAVEAGIDIYFSEFNATLAVSADPTRLKQVLINLLTNAVKYNRPAGQVEVHCSLVKPERVRVSVRDTGIGLSEFQLTQVFQPFNRLGQEATLTKGTGIGLVVSQRLVNLMGGELGVDSTVGVGSVFWFELDLAQVQVQQPPAAPQALAASPQQAVLQHNPAPRSVLYVEDNPANMALIEQLLTERGGLILLGAQDAMRGVDMARTYKPEVIVMDINLPGISGFEALKILQTDPTTAHIPVMALSANAMVHDIKKGLAAGFYAYITKPIRVNEFFSALDKGLALAARKP
jgi:PAS domain S-box-containing protein